jgi:polysaccharide deacetylase 2 family uncharacterized protein YibQ
MGERHRIHDAAALGLVEALEGLGIEPSAIDRRSAPQLISGQPGAERWTIQVPRQGSLVECNLAVTRAAGRLGLEVQDAWEHRYRDKEGDCPALSISLATAGQGAHRVHADGGVDDADAAARAAHERFCLTFVRFPAADRGLMAIVIDDFGSSWSEAARKFLEFPAPITVAVLPGYKSSRRIADAARERGYEVILHLPMEPEGYPRVKPGPEVILVQHKPAEVKARMRRALKSVGPVVGISNHMGSLATADADLMRLVLAETDRRDLFFFDSRTTPKSVVEREALRLGTPCVANRLFIDRDRSREKIAKRLNQAIKIALEEHEVVLIGHPYPETLEVLTKALPRLAEQGVRIVTLSELVPKPLVD